MRLIEQLDRICLQQFEESDVRLLLMELRPELRQGDGRVQQIADGLAHPEGLDYNVDAHVRTWIKWQYILMTYNGTFGDIVRKIPKVHWKHILDIVREALHPDIAAAPEQAVQFLKKHYKEKSDCYRVKEAQLAQVQKLLLIAFGCLKVSALTANDLVRELRLALERSGIDFADAWGRLLEVVAGELSLAVAGLLNSTAICVGAGKHVVFELGKEDPITVYAIIPGLPGEPRLGLPFLETPYGVKDRVGGGKVAECCDGKDLWIPEYVARRSDDGKLRLFPAFAFKSKAVCAAQVMDEELRQAKAMGKDLNAVKAELMEKYSPLRRLTAQETGT
jgi:hypothetical protein